MIRRSFILAVFACLAVGHAHAADPAPPADTGEDPGAEIFLPRMLVPAIQNDQVLRHYALLIKLKLAKKEEVDLVKKAMDRLQDAFVFDLNDVAAQGSHFDAPRAQRRMLASAKRVLGRADIITDIVFERVLERRITN